MGRNVVTISQESAICLYSKRVFFKDFWLSFHVGEWGEHWGHASWRGGDLHQARRGRDLFTGGGSRHRRAFQKAGHHPQQQPCQRFNKKKSYKVVICMYLVLFGNAVADVWWVFSEVALLSRMDFAFPENICVYMYSKKHWTLNLKVWKWVYLTKPTHIKQQCRGTHQYWWTWRTQQQSYKCGYFYSCVGCGWSEMKHTGQRDFI